MRLIDADAENERLLDFIAQHDSGIQYALEHKDMTILEDIFFEFFEEQPTAFDLESVIEKIEGERNFVEQKMIRTSRMESLFNQRVAYNKVLEILKSAANVTNGKIGE